MTLHPRRYDYVAKTGACVQCSNIYSLLYTMCTATSELWQWACHRIETVIYTDPGYVTPQWLVLSDVTLRPKMKRQVKIWLIGHYIHFVVWNSSSVTLHEFMDFFQRACKLKRYRKRTTFLALTWRNVHGEILILFGTPFLLTP